MKTPREILLQKHAAASKQLDEIRAGVISGLPGRAPVPGAKPAALPVWAEFFWSLRGHLAALAGAWILIALLNGQTATDRPVLATSQGNVAAAKLLLLARENRMHVRELLGAETNATQTAAPAPRPRSQSEPGAIWPIRPSANC